MDHNGFFLIIKQYEELSVNIFWVNLIWQMHT